jgi:hypothetical protein
MKFLKRWFARKCREAWEEGQNEPTQDSVISSKRHRNGIGLISTSDNPGEGAPTINFSVSFAQGGKILATSFYDHRTDRHNRTVHVITDEDDFAERVKEIVFKECLTRG